MGRLLAILDCAHEFEVGLHRLFHERDHLLGDRRGEHERLSINLFSSREKLHDILNGGPEALVEQPIGFVEDERLQGGCANARRRVRQQVFQSAGRADE